MSEECKSLGSRLVTEHDRLFGPGTGKAFVEGRYASDLPRALKARIGPAMERQDAQPAKAEEPSAPPVTATEKPVQVPPPALLPREPEEADGMKPRTEEPKAVVPAFPEEAAIREQPAAETAPPPVVLRTAEVTAAKPRYESRPDWSVPPNRAYSLAYLTVFAGAALFATGRAFGGRKSEFAR
jgi:hypothetical protein